MARYRGEHGVKTLSCLEQYLCMAFAQLTYRSTKAAVKLHTLLDLRGNIPTFLHISDGKLHDVNILDMLLPEAGAFYVMDRAYIDFEGSFACTRPAASS